LEFLYLGSESSVNLAEMFLKSDFGDPDEIALAAAIRQRRQSTDLGIVKRGAEVTGNAREDFRPA
jgi:hypothetical protein